jgi:hypothetical protein
MVAISIGDVVSDGPCPMLTYFKFSSSTHQTKLRCQPTANKRCSFECKKLSSLNHVLLTTNTTFRTVNINFSYLLRSVSFLLDQSNSKSHVSRTRDTF